MLQSGLDWLEERTGKPVLGVVPYLDNFYLDAEDAINTQQLKDDAGSLLKVVVPVLPRISNHTDFDALRLHPQVNLQYVSVQQTCPDADLIILPGSKNVRADLAQLKQHGWAEQLQRHLRYGGKLLGICGGYQMLGRVINDPMGVEDVAGSAAGFSFFDMETTLEASKQLRNVSGVFIHRDFIDVAFDGYEIHCGQTIFTGAAKPDGLLQFPDGRIDGVYSHDNQIFGTYIHGLFDRSEVSSAVLRWAGLREHSEYEVDISMLREKQLDRLADTLQENLQPEFLKMLAG